MQWAILLTVVIIVATQYNKKWLLMTFCPKSDLQNEGFLSSFRGTFVVFQTLTQ